MPQDNFEARFQLLFTLASLPGIVLPFFSGWIVDRIGGRLCLLVLSLLCFLGQMASSIGVEKERWPVTLTGRFIYGLGFESLFVANQAFLATWFEGGRLGMALGVSTASSYIGYLLSFIISPIAANRISVAFSFWLGAMVKAVSVLAAIAIYVLCPSNINRHRTPRSERSRGRVAQIGNVFEPSNSNRNKSESSAHPSTEANECSIADRNPLSVTATGTNEQMVIGASRSCFCSHLQGFSVSFWLLCISCCLVYSTTVPFINLASGLLLERNLFIKVPEECALKHPDRCSSGYLEPADGNEASCPTAATYAPVLPSSLNISSTDSDPSWYKSSYVYEDLQMTDIDCTDSFWSEACARNYCEKQEMATQRAGLLMAIPFIATVATTFLFGYFGVDRAGLRAEMVALGPVLLMTAHSLFLFRRSSPVIPLILLGLGFSMSVSALWPSVPLTVGENVAGAAFGLMTCTQNIGLTLFPIMCAAIYNAAGHHYLPNVEIFLLGCSALAVLVGIALYLRDRRHGSKLSIRRKER